MKTKHYSIKIKIEQEARRARSKKSKKLIFVGFIGLILKLTVGICNRCVCLSRISLLDLFI